MESECPTTGMTVQETCRSTVRCPDCVVLCVHITAEYNLIFSSLMTSLASHRAGGSLETFPISISQLFLELKMQILKKYLKIRWTKFTSMETCCTVLPTCLFIHLDLHIIHWHCIEFKCCGCRMHAMLVSHIPYIKYQINVLLVFILEKRITQ